MDNNLTEEVMWNPLLKIKFEAFDGQTDELNTLLGFVIQTRIQSKINYQETYLQCLHWVLEKKKQGLLTKKGLWNTQKPFNQDKTTPGPIQIVFLFVLGDVALQMLWNLSRQNNPTGTKN